MKRTLAVAVLAAVLLPVYASDEGAVAEARSRVQKLAPLMAGQWKGTGYVRSREGRVEFTSEESIEPRMDGAALLIEGRHRDAKSGAMHFQATGVVAWDAPRQEYRMLSAVFDGKTGSFPLREQPDGRYVWTIAPERGPVMRYTITLDPPGRWNEVGDMSADGGATWSRFFEMNLERVAGPGASR